MMHSYSCEPFCPVWVIALWGLVCLGLLLHTWRLQKSELPPRIRTALLTLRLAALLAFTVFLLRPWRETALPQTDGCRVLILADASASMTDHEDAMDKAGQFTTRWRAIVEALPEQFPWPVERLRFAETGLHEWSENPAAATALPGETALGTALEEALESAKRPGALPLGAVVLLSDGRETAQGSSLIEAARHARNLQIPVSTFGVGSQQLPSNAAIAFTARRLTVPQGKTFQVTAKATSDFPEELPIEVTILDNLRQVIKSSSATLLPNGSSDFAFELPPIDTAGDYAFTARLSGQGRDGCPSDDQDTILVKVEEPPRRRLLYLASNPGWEWRFLRTVVEHSNFLEISAILRIGRETASHEGLSADFRPTRLFHRLNLPSTNGEDTGFPETPGAYADFDAVVLECSAAAQFSASQCEALDAFVTRRGGGLLLTGNPELLPDELRKFLPAKDFEERQAVVRNGLQVARDFLFEDTAATRLFANGVGLPARTHYLVTRTPKPASRVALRDSRGDALLVAQGNYGAGRVAWLGLSESWRWCLAEDIVDGRLLHQEFWDLLLTWLGSNRQPILQPELPVEDLPVGKPVTLAARVLGPDFLPAPAAQIVARVRVPMALQEKSGVPQEVPTEMLTFSPSAEELGLYETEYLPRQPGAYTVEFTALATPEAVAVSAFGVFLVRDYSREATESTACSELLADVARMTGGAVLSHPISWTTLPLSERIPMVVTRKYFLETIPFALILIALWCVEWWLRRRHGLK